MNELARAFADGISAVGADMQNVLHVYENGFVVAVACSPGRHSLIYEMLQRDWPQIEEARSKDGFISVFIVRDQNAANATNFPAGMVAVSDGLSDHRLEDHSTIEVAAELMRRSCGIGN